MRSVAEMDRRDPTIVPIQRLPGLLALLLLCVPVTVDAQDSDPFLELRRQMVDEQIQQRGIRDREVLDAMRSIPRHLFVPEPVRKDAYVDHPLPIGSGQTISQPYIVGLMTSLLELDGTQKVLEIGTGSGYQAAVLSKLAKEVYSIEIREPLGAQATQTLADLGYSNVHVRIGNGYLGWPEQAPFDAIIVTAAPEEVPQALIEQLREGGRMVLPVGIYLQDLVLLTKTADGIAREEVTPVRFVPMIGRDQEEEDDE